MAAPIYRLIQTDCLTVVILTNPSAARLNLKPYRRGSDHDLVGGELDLVGDELDLVGGELDLVGGELDLVGGKLDQA